MFVCFAVVRRVLGACNSNSSLHFYNYSDNDLTIFGILMPNDVDFYDIL